MSKISQKYQKLSQLQQEKAGKEGKKEETPITFYPCIVCGKEIGEGYYGAWGDRGVCSKSCNTIQSQKPKYPGHTEEDFFKRQQLEGNNHGQEA